MNCQFHKESIGVNECDYCGRNICGECEHDLNNRILCPLCFKENLGREKWKALGNLFALFAIGTGVCLFLWASINQTNKELYGRSEPEFSHNYISIVTCYLFGMAVYVGWNKANKYPWMKAFNQLPAIGPLAGFISKLQVSWLVGLVFLPSFIFNNVRRFIRSIRG